MNIIEAVNAFLHDRKKIFRKEQPDYLYTFSGKMVISILDILADDWEIYEEPKSAMDKAWDKESNKWKQTNDLGFLAKTIFENGWKAHEDHINHIKVENFQDKAKLLTGQSTEYSNFSNNDLREAIKALKNMFILAKDYEPASMVRDIEKRFEDHIKAQSK